MRSLSPMLSDMINQHIGSPENELLTPQLGNHVAMLSDELALASEEVASTRDEMKHFQEENNQLKEEKLCKICMEEAVTVTFVPCGHFVCCNECSIALTECPICRGGIEQRIKTYMN